MSELQRLTERLGEALSRSVAIDDAKMRLLTHSPHYGAVDDHRLASILTRQASADAVAWAERNGNLRATTATRLPAQEDLGMLARLCVSIRYQGKTLGFLWIIDHGSTLTPEQVALAEEAAAEAAVLLFRDSLVDGLARARQRELLRDLIDPDQQLRSDAVVRLSEESLFDPGRAVTVLALDTDRARANVPLESVERVLAEVRRQLPPRRSLALVRPDHAILLISHERRADISDWAARLLAAFGAEAARR